MYDFLGLPHVVQVEVVTELGLIAEGDDALGNNNRKAQYFKRASERNLLGELRALIDKNLA